MKFTFTLNKAEIDAAYKQALSEAAKNFKAKGFRPGQAPVKMVEEQVGKTKIQEHAIEHALPVAFAKALTTKGIDPVGLPQIKLLKKHDNGDFEFEAEVAERPTVTFKDYEKAVKAELATSAIWTPDKGEQPAPSQDEQMQKVFKALLDSCSVEVPGILISQEADRMQTRIINQVTAAGLEMEKYLTSMNKTPESLRSELETSARENLSLEFILGELIKVRNVVVTEEEVDKVIASIGDESLKKRFQDITSERDSLRYTLQKNEVVRQLLQLAK